MLQRHRDFMLAQAGNAALSGLKRNATQQIIEY
jgi:hypothetical protein